MITKCHRCGKEKHTGGCGFTAGKKSVLETISDDVKTAKTDIDKLKKK